METSYNFSPVLLAGNFLSQAGGSRSVLEDLGDRLAQDGHLFVGTSRRRNGVIRGLDLVTTALRTPCRVAVVDLYSGRAFLWGEALSIILSALGRPFVLVLRGGGLPHFARKHPRRVAACLARAQAVTVPSRFLLEHMKPYRSDLVLLPNPLQVSAYSYRNRSNPEPRLIWVRAFERLYNPALAAEVMALIATDFPAVRLTMLGSDRKDGSWQKTEAAAARANLRNHLELAGGVNKKDVPHWLSASDIFLNTTNVDNTPVSVMEAMACGLCIVSTNVGGIPYLLEHEVDALLVPPGNALAMAAAVRRLLTEPGLAATLSANAAAKAQQFDWTTVYDSWKRLLASAAETAA